MQSPVFVWLYLLMGGGIATTLTWGFMRARARMTAAQLKAQNQIEMAQITAALQNRITELQTTLTSERTHHGEKLMLLLQAKEELSHQFKTIASTILDEKNKVFSEQSQNSIGQLLVPVQLKISEFHQRLEQIYGDEAKERRSLSHQVKSLVEANHQLSQEADHLARALRGSAKTQGTWGELILETVLENSGLRRGEEYDVQESHRSDEGKLLRPDVVVHLPNHRHIIIDAKVSLNAYNDYCNSAENDNVREIALKQHLNSVRNHIKELSARHYQALYGTQPLDFVLMFVPIEPAFLLALQHDPELQQFAWKNNILFVCPSTLLFALRMVSQLWRQEAQNRNTLEIAKCGGELYDKLTAFVSDLQKLGDRLRQAQEHFNDAQKKLAGGKKSVIARAESLRGLGIHPTKQLPHSLIEQANHEEPLITPLPELSAVGN